MYIIRDSFQLKFGSFREAFQLIKEAMDRNEMPEGNTRVLTDFTGPAYRLIFESEFESLQAYEETLRKEMSTSNFQNWYGQFKLLVLSSNREILKVGVAANECMFHPPISALSSVK